MSIRTAIRITAHNLSDDIMESLDEGTQLVDEADLEPTANWAEALINAEIDSRLEFLLDDRDAVDIDRFPALLPLYEHRDSDSDTDRDQADQLDTLLRRYTRLLLWAAGDMQND